MFQITYRTFRLHTLVYVFILSFNILCCFTSVSRRVVSELKKREEAHQLWPVGMQERVHVRAHTLTLKHSIFQYSNTAF